jgi:energy-coupling factor transport system permease protein
MALDITLGQFFPGDSPLHRLDPRAKLLLTLALIVGVFLADSYPAYVIFFAYVLAAAWLSKIPIKLMLKGLKAVYFIIALTFVLNAFFGTGKTVLVHWQFLTVTREGLRIAVFMALRLMLLVFGTQLLTLTTSPIALTDGLERLFSPFAKIGFPAHEMAMMMSIALRFIPTLLEEADKIMKAQTARGADFETGNLMAGQKR